MDIHLKKRKKLNISLSVDLGEYIHFRLPSTNHLISHLRVGMVGVEVFQKLLGYIYSLLPYILVCNRVSSSLLFP